MSGVDDDCEIEEMLLYSARHGDLAMVRELLEARSYAKVTFDISCHGRAKSNQGWTPLHLATYFGHIKMVQLLLDNGADIDALNDAGDTALHKAAFIGREDIVLMLVERGASVSVINGEGQTPRHVTDSGEVSKLLLAAEQTDARRREERFLAAARAGHLDAIHKLLRADSAPSINCVDSQGNSGLHCAAYRGHKEVAVLLLQNGIDTKIKNLRGQTALDLAKDDQMHQVLSVQPVRRLLKSATRFEGLLLKRSRFLGWKPVWVVLERGVMAYFACRADAVSGVKRKDFKYLDGARVVPVDGDECSFLVSFSDSTVHRLSVVNDGDATQQISRQKWLNAVQEHAAFSSHYLSQGKSSFDDSDGEDEHQRAFKPLGSMQDALQTASAHHQVLAQKLADSASALDSARGSESCEDVALDIHKNFQLVSDSAASMLGALGHCLTLFQQQEEVRQLQLRQEQERVRVLEEALHVLAREHHELEQSVAMSQAGSPPPSLRLFDPSDDEFYDAFEADSDSEETLVTAASPDSDTLRSFNLHHSASSCTLVSTGALSPVSDVSFHSAFDRPHRPRRVSNSNRRSDAPPTPDCSLD